MRLVGYVRVSRVGGREGDSFISPALQREQISALAKARRHQVVEWIEDLDESGGRWERPGFQRALEMVETGEVDGIAVAKLDRFARSVKDALAAIERIEAVGGQLVSVADNLDTTTPIGRAMLKIILVFAELERDRQREGFADAKRSAIVDRGIHMSTLVPVGYRRGHDRRLVKDPRAARAVVAVFQRRAAGASYGELAEFLDRRLPRDDAGAWPKTTIAKMIANRVYLGEARQGAIVNPDAHVALVSRAEWEAAQAANGAPSRRSGSLLSGLLECGNCGHPLQRATTLDYGCRARRSSGVCPAPVTVRIRIADEFVTGRFLEWASRQEVEIRAADRDGAVEFAVEQLEQAERELAAYRDANLVSVIGADAFREGLQARAGGVDGARERLLGLQAERVVPFPHYDAVSLWPGLSVVERRLLIESAVERVVVLGGTGVLAERLRVCWYDGEDEAGLAGA